MVRQGKASDPVQHLARSIFSRWQGTRRLPVLLAMMGLLFMVVPAAELPSAHAVVEHSLALGHQHTCILTSTGEVKCWGHNEEGQLGNGKFQLESLTPVSVIGISGATELASGRAHVCAATSTGVQCWGWNFRGQLGYGKVGSVHGPEHERRSTPVDVVGLGGNVVDLTAGEHHTCAITSSGGLKCWGYNGHGELGDGKGGTPYESYSSTPVDVQGLGSGVVDVAAGTFHTCAVTDSGGVKCWGSNEHGQLGNGASGPGTDALTPVDVTGLTSGAVAVDAGVSHTCALTNSGRVKCWGKNDAGQLGNGAQSAMVPTPVDVQGLSDAVRLVGSGSGFTCALTSGGRVTCWGDDDVGQRGDGNVNYTGLSPVDVIGLASGATALDVGSFHACGVLHGSSVRCWGWNNYGQLGNNDPAKQNSPVPVGVSGLSLGQAAPLFTSALPPTKGTVGTSYGHTFAASGSPLPTYNLSGGSLPPNLTLDSTTGVLTGTLTTVGTYPNITVTAANGVAPAATQTFTITVQNAPTVTMTITSGAPPSGTYGSSYSHTFTTSGSAAPTFNVTSGALPPGLTLNSSTGVLSGTPTAAGTYADIVVTADNGSATATQTVTITVDKAPLTITADDKTRPVGSAYPPLTASYSGFVNGDTPQDLDTPVTLTTTATVNSPEGTYPIIASGASDANYTIIFEAGTLTVTDAVSSGPPVTIYLPLLQQL